MIASRQRPLDAPRDGDARNLATPLVAYEAAVFDQATYFAVVRFRTASPDGGRYDRREFSVFPWAVRYAEGLDDACVYAVTESGRFCLLDRERLGEWETRWRETR